MSLADRRPPTPIAEPRLLDRVASNRVVQTYLTLADQFTGQLGYTEHGLRHAGLVGAIAYDILDLVNYSATHSFVRVDPERRTITLELEIDTTVSDILEYFEIFLTRMMQCRRSAEGLGCKFRMTVNGNSLL